MRLPRRHPFASHGGQAEISHLYALFYPSAAVPHYEADAQRAHGVHLVQSLYLAKGGCPVAIECTSSLVSSLLLDHQLTGCAAADAGPLTPPPAISLAVRQTLTLSLIRLVNTLADSLQKGAFARSIASIAERELGLPQWFVEFRHRGTHEELPSLEICREVVGSALAWIEGAYWLPTLRDAERRRVRALDRRSQGSISYLTGAFQLPEKHKDASAQVQHPSGSGSTLLFPSSASQVASSSLTPAEKLQRNHIPTLQCILRNYKRLSKLLVRDESLRGRSRAEMQGIYRDLDNWIQAARRDVGEGYRTTALTRGMNQSGSRRQVGWANEDEDESDSEQDEESRGNVRPGDPTLDCLIGVLLSSTEGVGLIPLSKNKRAKRARGQEEGGEALPSLPEELLMAWSGLLNHLGKGDPAGQFSFIESWLQSMIELLLGTLVTAQGDLAESPGTQMDTSSRLTLLAWIKFILDALAFTATPPSGPPASANDEVTSLRLCICARLLQSRSGKDREQDKERGKQIFLLSLAEKLLLQRGVSSQSQAQEQASLAALLRDVTARLDLATRGRLQTLMELLPPVSSLPEEQGKGESEVTGEAEGARKKRRLPTQGSGEEDSFPLLKGFEEMDSGTLPAPPPEVPIEDATSIDVDPRTSVGAVDGGSVGDESLMDEMERRWRQVLASSSSSSTTTTASTTAAPLTSTLPPPPATEPLPLPRREEDDSPPQSPGSTATPPRALAPTLAPTSAAPPPAASSAAPPPLPKGWSLFPLEEEWRATPIGMIRLRKGVREGGEGEGGQEEKEGRAVVPDFHGLFTGRGTRAGIEGTREEMAL